MRSVFYEKGGKRELKNNVGMRKKEYARAVHETLGSREGKEESKIAESLLRVIRFRGDQKLLPSIILELQTLDSDEKDSDVPTLVIAREGDEGVLEEEIRKDREAFGFKSTKCRVRIDDSIIGGYRLESKDQLIDRTHKRALLEMYRKMILS